MAQRGWQQLVVLVLAHDLRGLLFIIALPSPATTRILIARDFGEKLNKLANAL